MVGRTCSQRDVNVKIHPVYLIEDTNTKKIYFYQFKLTK